MNKQSIRSLGVGFFVAFVACLSLSTWGPLSDDGSVGRHVVTSLLVAVAVSAALAWLDRRQKTAPEPEVVLDDLTAAQVDELLAEGKKVTAVKVVRDATGAALKPALTTVEARERHSRPSSPEHH